MIGDGGVTAAAVPVKCAAFWAAKDFCVSLLSLYEEDAPNP